MRIVLLRHAQTPGNALKRYIGHTDEPLSPEGEAAARLLGGCEDVSRVYVSPLLRARQTTSLFFPKAELVPVEGLREMDFGDFDGLNYLELGNDPRYQEWVDANCETPCPHGESKDGFTRRTANALRELFSHAAEQGEEDLVVVAHGGTIMSAMDAFVFGGGSYYSWHVENCEGFCAKVEPTLLGGFEFSDYRKIVDEGRARSYDDLFCVPA